MTNSSQPTVAGSAVPMIAIKDMWKRYGRLDVLKGIDLVVPRGSVTCLIGPSGSGKSTLLRCVNHLEHINSGRVEVDGELIGYKEKDGKLYEISEKDAAKQRLEIGMVFQHFNLFTHRTVLELSLIHISEPTRREWLSRMPSSA